jgi:hypothetical protein
MSYASKLIGRFFEQMGRHLETPESLKFLGPPSYSEPSFDEKPLSAPETATIDAHRIAPQTKTS